MTRVGGTPFPIFFPVSNTSLNTPFEATFTNMSSGDITFTIGSQNVTGVPAGTQMLGPNGKILLVGLVPTSTDASITVNITSPSARSLTNNLSVGTDATQNPT
jgi:hypothetical protein